MPIQAHYSGILGYKTKAPILLLSFILHSVTAMEPKNEQCTAENGIGSTERQQVSFLFRPPESGSYSFVIKAPKSINPLKSIVMIRNNKSEYVLDDNYEFANDDSYTAGIFSPVKTRPTLSAEEDYFVTALFAKTDSKGPFVLKAIKGYVAVDIVSYLGNSIGQNMRSGISIVNTSLLEMKARVSKDTSDSAAWTTIAAERQERWERAADIYTIDVIVQEKYNSSVQKRHYTLEIKKGEGETIIAVTILKANSDEKSEILVHNADILKLRDEINEGQ